MTSSSLPRGLPAGADSRSIIAADLVLGFGCSFFSQDPPGCSDRVAASQPQESWNLASNQVWLGPIFCISSPRWQSSALAQGTELRTCVLVSDFLKDTGTDSPLFRWQGIQKWVFPCTPVSRPRPATKSFPTAWLRQNLPFLHHLGKGFLFSSTPWPPLIILHPHISSRARYDLSSGLENCAALEPTPSRRKGT